MSKNDAAVNETLAKLAIHNAKKSAVKEIAKAVALNVVAPIVAVAAAQIVINHINRDK